ncbi:MAG: CDP-alcohol phosphatidyltransferase family protein [Pseudomonadota bacterium]
MSLFIVRLNRVDLLTLSGVASAALAAGAALDGKTHLATSLLFLAMLVDALDGIWARRRGVVRDFGRYLDGFMDVLVYLATPALVLYLHGFSGFWSLALLAMTAAGCIRLSVFNDTGNIRTEDIRTGGGRLAYLGMPVFWSLFILGGFLLLEYVLPPIIARSLLALALVAFSVAMLLNRPFFKFTALWQILALTLGGATLFLVLHLRA